MANRARELAAEYVAKGDPLGWFEPIYREGGRGVAISWIDRKPNPFLLDFWRTLRIDTRGRRALVVGCGLGDDAEQLALWGFATTAFDISPTAIAQARERFADTNVAYLAANVLDPPASWSRAFDFVFEAYTLQVLPPELRAIAMQRIADCVAEEGSLLVIARARELHEPKGAMPWPLTRDELGHFSRLGLRETMFVDRYDDEEPPVRRFMVRFERQAS